MAIKILVNPFEAPTTNPKHELGIIVSDVRGGGQGNRSFQEVLPGEGTGTSGYPTAITTPLPSLSPDAEFQYIRNADTDAIIAGSAVMLTLAATDENGAVEFGNGTNRSCEGVAVRTIAAGSYGWIQVRGKVPVPSTNTNSDAERRGGVRVNTDVATDAILGLSATDGVMVAISTATSYTSAVQSALAGRRIRTIDAGVNLATTGGTDYRAEAVIY